MPVKIPVIQDIAVIAKMELYKPIGEAPRSGYILYNSPMTQEEGQYMVNRLAKSIR